MSKFLSGLSPTLKSQVRGQLLGGDNILTLAVSFSRVMCVSTGADVSSALSMNQTLDVIKVIVVVVVMNATLEDMAHLARDTMFLVDD